MLHLFIPSISSAPKLFDIIDVSNLIDATSGISSRSGYLDVSGVLPKIGVPLLKHDGVLISLFMNYIGNLDLYLGDEFTTEHIKDAGLKCVKYFGREFFRNHISGTGALEVANIGLVRTMDITSHFRDADDAWTAYMAWRRFEEIARETDMRMKKWHMKTRLNFDEGRDRMEVLKDWRMNCLGGISGNECYVLWEKK